MQLINLNYNQRDWYFGGIVVLQRTDMIILFLLRTSNALGEVVRSIFRKSVVNSRSKTGVQINMDELRNGIHHTGFGKVRKKD